MGKSENREVFEIYAVKYAHNANRTRNGNMLYMDEHDVPMPLDYFVWVIKNNMRTYVVDTGFGAVASKKRAAPLLRTPAEGLALMDINAAKVDNVIISHMPYAHAGGISDFPNAKFILQDREMSYATGRCLCFPAVQRPFEVDDVCEMVRKIYGNQVHFVDGDEELVPGLSVHKIGGHSAGLMCVRVWTQRGWVVVASDCAHFYENIRERNPFVIVYNLGELVHEFNIATKDMHINHQPEMMKMVENEILLPDRIDKQKMMEISKKDHSMAHKHSNSVLLSPGEKAELIWKFSNTVDIEAACNVPGHYDVGMIAKISNI